MTMLLATKTQILHALDDLSPESLATVAEFVEFLRAKTTSNITQRVIKLGGLWQGYAFSDNDLLAARHEVWASLGQDIDG